MLWFVAAALLPAHGAADVPFRVGERLSYQVFWGPFVAGRASLEVEGIEPVDGTIVITS